MVATDSVYRRARMEPSVAKRGNLPTVLREPLLHFCALGALLFGLHQLIKPAEPERSITVDSQRQQELNALFKERQGRPPTGSEARQLALGWLDDEVLFRESLRLDLARQDPDLRDQMVAHMRALLQASASVSPSEQQLREHYQTHSADYRQPETVSFVDYPVASGSAAEDSARELLRRLRVGERVPQLPMSYQQSSRAQLDTLLGTDITSKVMTLSTGSWQLLRGKSGLHVVKLDARSPASLPDFLTVRDRVLADVRTAQTQVGFRRSLEQLRERFALQIAEPSP